jgi:opacity protein-like surface antigen
MKKIAIAVVALVGCLAGANAQDIDFGITAGYMNARGVVKVDDVSISANESGFYGGIMAEFSVADKIGIQPELLYASIDGSDGILLPILLEYAITPKLHFQAGPQLVFSLEDLPDDITGVEFDLAGGIGYDITDAFFAEARYTFQVNNSYTGPEDIKIRGNYLTIGLGYKFF